MVRWLSGNWIWLVVVGGMLWMHLGMHRGHGAHGHDMGSAPQQDSSSAGEGSHVEHGSTPARASSHRHRGC